MQVTAATESRRQYKHSRALSSGCQFGFLLAQFTRLDWKRLEGIPHLPDAAASRHEGPGSLLTGAVLLAGRTHKAEAWRDVLPGT